MARWASSAYVRYPVCHDSSKPPAVGGVRPCPRGPFCRWSTARCVRLHTGSDSVQLLSSCCTSSSKESCWQQSQVKQKLPGHVQNPEAPARGGESVSRCVGFHQCGVTCHVNACTWAPEVFKGCAFVFQCSLSKESACATPPPPSRRRAVRRLAPVRERWRIAGSIGQHRAALPQAQWAWGQAEPGTRQVCER